MSSVAIEVRRPRLLATARSVWPTALLGCLVVAGARWGPDWPAQEFRAWLAGHGNLSAWTNHWYGGQALPGYSVLYPPLSAVLGAGGVGLVSVIAAAWGADTLRPSGGVALRRCYRVAVAVSLLESLVIGQIPFLMGAAFGVWSLWAVRTRRPVLALVLAAGCSLCSPLAGGFLLMIAPAWALSTSWRRAAPLLAGATGIVASAILGGASGPFPCPWQSLVGVLAFSLGVVVMTTRDERALRCFALCYSAAALVAFAVPNPIGGNIGRIGKLIAMPLAVHLLTGRSMRSRAAVTVAALTALVWPGVPFATSVAEGARDPSQYAAYYRGLNNFLRTQDPTSGRLEIPFTRGHWEAMWVAQSFPIARGWERQADLQVNKVLYNPLDKQGYRHWLDDNAVELVALPNVAIDSGGQAEAKLLRRPPGYLQPIWHNRDWQVWRVQNSRPLTRGVATMSRLDEASFTLRFAEPGTAVVRIRASKMWEITSGAGCVQASPDGWLTVHSALAGELTVSAKVGLGLVSPPNQCTGPAT